MIAETAKASASTDPCFPPETSHWVNVVTHLAPKYGGISAVVPSICSAVSQMRDHTLSLVGFCHRNERCVTVAANSYEVRPVELRSRWLSAYLDRPLVAAMVEKASGVHIHGLWEQSSFLFARAASRLKKPYIVSAHGMLQPWALNNRRLKKWLYGLLIERRNLGSATCLHALTEAEVQEYRAYGLTNPIAVIPNAVEVPASIDRELFLSKFPLLRGKRLVLFLGRVHRKKGVHILCQAWKKVAQSIPDCHLVVAGPDFEDTRASLESFIQSNQLAQRATFVGMLNNSLKWSAYAAAQLFVLPSYSEGLSMSLLEALGTGLPVIVTRECNLPEVAQDGCGWVIRPEVEPLQEALLDALSANATVLSEMAARGRALVLRQFSWQQVGQQFSSLYSWAQGGPVPSNLTLDFGKRH